MSVVALATASAVVAVLAIALVASLASARRLRRTTEDRVGAAVDELSARMEAMVGDLEAALESAREESRRSRMLGGLGGTIDLDEVLERVLDAAGGVDGADAGILSLDGGIGGPLAATFGLPAEQVQQSPPAEGPPDGREARAIELRYRYTADEERAGDLIRGGVAVPVRTEAGRIGTLAVYTRGESHRFDEEALRALEEIAERTGPAVENARRFREARHLADLDALTGLHNRRYFHEMLAREVARAHRYDRRLALVVFDLDDFKAVNDRIGHLAGDAVLAEVAERVLSVVRSADVACRIGGDEFAVVLPESSLEDAEQLSERLRSVVSTRPIVQAGRLEVSAGVAELQRDDDATGFFERADDALYRAKADGKARVVAAAP